MYIEFQKNPQDTFECVLRLFHVVHRSWPRKLELPMCLAFHCNSQLCDYGRQMNITITMLRLSIANPWVKNNNNNNNKIQSSKKAHSVSTDIATNCVSAALTSIEWILVHFLLSSLPVLQFWYYYHYYYCYYS